MHLLLVNPWIYDFSAYDLWAKPLGLLKIAEILLKLRVKISLIDCLDRYHPFLKDYLKGRLPRSSVYRCGNYYTERVEKPHIFKDIPRYYKRYGMPRDLFLKIVSGIEKPDMILVTSAMTYWYPGVFETIRLLKQRFPKIPLVLGGIYARLCFRHAKDNSGADYVYPGKDIREILKIIDDFCGTKLSAEQIDFKNTFYAYQLYPEISYITLRGSEGCPFRCSYCGWYLLEERYSFVEPEFILEKIQFYYKRGIRNFAFYDDAFLYNCKEYGIKIMQGIIKLRIKANFHTPNGLNICYIDKEVANLLKKSGFVHPRLGLEFISSEEQKRFGKKTEFSQFLKVLSYLRKAGYNSSCIGVNLMIGLPGEDIREIEEAIRILANLNLRIHLEEYSPVPGTELYSKTGLSENLDPLWHNNSIFSFYFDKEKYYQIQKIKDKVHKLNSKLLKDIKKNAF
ncbi:MAG: radical SAM protein [Candidatus Omnitrophica bacterium]|nr:radical SAM protein [Candidatus Omnitrophota bacterium]